MATTMRAAEPDAPDRQDHRIFLHEVSWTEYEAILAIRGESPVPRISYLEGELELMSPSLDHEQVKKSLARLLEAHAEESGLALNGYGSWTIKRKREERGAEPDECYVLGAHRPRAPDLAIEVVWTQGGLDKLEIYRGLGVREVWQWRRGAIRVHVLRDDGYVVLPRSSLLPGLDLKRLAAFAAAADQTKAVRAYRAWLRRGDRGR